MASNTMRTDDKTDLPVKQHNDDNHGRAITILQFLNGALVTGGGIAFAKFAVTGFGTALGLIHLGIGIIGLVAALVAVRSFAGSRSFLLGINVVTIAYSTASEVAIYFGALLSPDAATDSLIGTLIAIAASISIIYRLSKVNRI